MSFFYNKYLFQCDYNYKHNISRKNNSIILQSLSIIFDLERFKKDSEDFIKRSSDLDTQLIGFLLFYLNTNSRPLIYLSNPKILSYGLKYICVGNRAEVFLYSNFIDFYSYFLSSLLFNKQKSEKLYFFKTFLTNSLFLKHYLRELFNISSFKKPFFLFNISLK